jgi:WD40 repeat protein
VQVWDAATWEPKVLRGGHSHHVTALAFGPDGRTVLSAGDDYTLRRWDLTRSGESQIVHQFDRSVLSVAFNPDGTTYATVATYEWYDKGQRGVVWEAATDRQRFVVDPPAEIFSLGFSPDGKMIAACGPEGNVHLWDAGHGRELHRFPTKGPAADRPAFSGDGKFLAAVTTATKSVKVWDVASGAEVHSWEDEPMYCVALGPDGRLLAAGHGDGTIALWDLAARDRKKRTLAGHSARVNTLRFTPDGKTLVSSSDDGTIRLWDPGHEQAAREIIPLGPANRLLMFDLDPSGRYLAAAGHGPVIYVLRLPGNDNADR